MTDPEAPTDAVSPEPTGDDERPAGDGAMVIFRFVVPAEELVLAETLRSFPAVVVEAERLVPTGRERVPYLRTTNGDPPGFADALAGDPDVRRAEPAATFDTGTIYRVVWERQEGGLFDWCAGSHAAVSLLEAVGRDGEWTVTLRFADRQDLVGFRRFCRARGTDVRVVRLYAPTEPPLGRFDLTRKQHEALLLALELGHFAVPREATLGDVADALGISSKSVSERIRRGQANLVGNALRPGGPTVRDPGDR